MPRVSGTLVLNCIAAVLGTVCFGWNLGVMNNPKDSIVILINETIMERYGSYLDKDELDFVWGLVVSMFAVGGMLGALLSGVWADRFGRRNGLLVNCGIGVVSALMMSLSKVARSFELLIAGRFFVGICSAINSGLVPLYLSEMATKELRGALGILNQLGIVFGLFISQALSLEEVLGTEQLWPVLMAICGLPSLLQLCLLPLCPESPRHLLLTRGDEEAARKGLIRLRPQGESVEEDINEMKLEAQEKSAGQKLGIKKSFGKLCSQWRPLLVGVVLHLSQKMSGISIMFYYSSSLFQDVGLDEPTAKHATLAVGGIMIVMTLVTIPLVDRLGRRTLHLAGLLGVVLSAAAFTIFAVVGLPQVSIAAALLIVVFVALGPGSIPWLMLSEMFAQDLRAPANAIGILANWSGNFAVGILFSPLQNLLQDYVFVPFGVLSGVFLVFLYFWMPETKGKTIEEVTMMLNPRSAKVSPTDSEEGVQEV